MPDKTPYQHVFEGSGRTYTITAQDYPHVGTNKLITCVGVYLPISEDRCFLAHINASARKLTTGVHFREVIDEEGQKIKRLTRDKLRECAKDKKWSPQDVQKCVAAGGRKVVLMCPCYDDVSGDKTRVGKYVVEGIREFLGANAALFMDEYFDNQELQGFVVNHKTGEVSMLRQQWGPDGVGGEERVYEQDEKFEEWREPWSRGDVWNIEIQASWMRGQG